MEYNYQTDRDMLLTEEGQVMFIKIRGNVQRLLVEAGAFRALEAWKDVTGDHWIMLACLDYLVELGEIKELTDDGVWGQHRVFVSARG